ncbi:MAG: DUF5615 family PIN-like protein [Dehalococcoidia bacterium]
MTLRFGADENFDRDIVRGLLLRNEDLDIVRVQDVGLRQADDPTVLEWVAREGRILLTHDIRTMTRYAYERVRQGKPMPGILEVPDTLPIGRAVEEILLVAECVRAGEWEGQVRYLPL